MGSRNSSFNNSPGVTGSRLRMSYLLVVINNFNIFRTRSRPPETDTILVIDSDAVLATAITGQSLQHIFGWNL